MKISDAEHLAFLKTLVDVRRAAGLSQYALAELLSLQQSFVSKYESGERRIDFLELIKICKALDLDLSEFIGRFQANLEKGG